MSAALGLAIFFTFMGIMLLLNNKFGSDEKRWFDFHKFNAETLIIIFFLSAFWCFVFS